ncbi:NAD(P)H-dependent oxidoreductase [Dyadobacter tibetensis]|uniref:NAD(P)H-dependent oxidoreductase n=1 Tax=Dyadobacter tibetensis TaxID=1211851 RepID=UPI000472649D|nr:NAD(P)H-dependent oxidoreductase [Dyadobacter tibetensis]
MSLIENLNWRYATKKMNGKRVSEEKLAVILEAAHLAPSSSGLQPFEIIVISNQELKEKIQPIAFGQSQIVDASHLLVFAAWDNYTVDRVNDTFSRANQERGLPNTATDAYRKNLLNILSGRSEAENFAHTAKQAYISLGLAMAAAAEVRVDATPMEGFDANALDTLLGLEARGLKSTAILPLGYRDSSEDWLVNLKKVRTPRDQFFTFLN